MNFSEFNHKITRCESQDDVIDIALQYVQENLRCNACAVSLYDEPSGTLVLKNKHTRNFGFCPREAYYELGQGITGRAVQSRTPIIISNIQKELKKYPGAYIFSSSQKVKSAIAVPINKGNRIYGAITADSDQTGFFIQSHTDSLSKISPLIGNALYRLQADEQNSKKKDEEEKTKSTRDIINSLIHEFGELGNEEHLLDRVLELLNLMIPYDACAIFSKEGGNSDISVIRSRNLNFSNIYNLQKSPVGNILARANTSILEADASRAIMRPEFKYLLENFSFCSCIAISYEVKANETNAIFLFHRQRDQYQTFHLIILSTISVLFSILREKEDLNKAVLKFGRQINVSELLSGTVHEVRNALMGIVGLSKELQFIFPNHENLQGSSIEIMEDIINTGDRVVNWLNELLASSQFQDRKLEQVEINQIVKRAISFLTYKAKEKNIDIIFEQYGTDIIAITDPGGLLQVLMNLILNPIQILGIGKKITIETSYESNGELPVIIKVHDNGKGIHKKDIDKVFRPYYTTKQGTGLGLTISRRILEGLGGTINVTSHVGHRTTFSIKLPKDSRNLQA